MPKHRSWQKIGGNRSEEKELANEPLRRPIQYRPIRDASQYCQVHCQGWADRDACVSALRPPSRGLLGVA